jgi:hypothetical protein
VLIILLYEGTTHEEALGVVPKNSTIARVGFKAL